MEILITSLNIAVLGFFAGIILNFMPCVLPLVAIKIAGFARLKTRAEARILAGFTVLGILCFCLLVALIFSLFQNLYLGFQLQFPSFIAILIFVFAVFFLVLMGQININLPISLSSFNSSIVEGFVSGFLIVAFSLSCIAPIVASAISLAFASGTPYTLFICLFFIGLGLGVPYILCGFFGLKINLKSNSILTKIAKMVSVLAIFTTISYLIFILHSQSGALLTSLVLISGSIFTLLLYKFKSFYILIFGIILVAIIPLFKVANVQKSPANSVPFSVERIETYLNQNRLVFVNISATWCVTCQANIASIFSTQRFQDFVKKENIVYMKGDFTIKSPEIEAFMRQFGAYGVPFYVIFSPKNRSGKVLPTFLTTEIFIQNIEDLK